MTVYEIRQAIKLRRESLSMRQNDLAELSGLTIKTIHLIESGSGNPTLETLDKLAMVLGMELLLQVKKAN